MKTILAQHAGFCEGVERAYRMALASLKGREPAFILGDLVHNKDVVNKMRRLGIKKVKDLRLLKANSTVIITAHGLPKETVRDLSKRGLKIVDTTCPWVFRAQRLARKLAGEGREIIIVGDKGHPEVVGLRSWAGRGARVVESPSDLKGVKLSEKLAVIAQTTQSRENFRRIVKALKRRGSDVVVYNTICPATSKRQSSAVKLAASVDLMVVVGDKRSANTKRLFELCSSLGVPTYRIEGAGEIKRAWFGKDPLVGVTAGASTPEWIIREVLKKVGSFK